MKVKDEIVDDAYADDYDEGELDKPLFDSDEEERDLKALAFKAHDEGPSEAGLLPFLFDDDVGPRSPMLVDSDAEEGGDKVGMQDDDTKSVADMDEEEFDDFASSQDSLAAKVCSAIKKGRSEQEQPNQSEKSDKEDEDDEPSQSLLPDSGSDMDWYAFPSDDDSDNASRGVEKEPQAGPSKESKEKKKNEEDILFNSESDEELMRASQSIDQPSTRPQAGHEEEKEENLPKQPQAKSPSRSSKMIDPLPHPPRRKAPLQNRGTSDAMKTFRADRQYFRSKSAPEVRSVARESKEDLKKKRTQALKELAEKDKRNDQVKKMGPPPASKVKQSVPKAQKLMDVDIFKQPSAKRGESESVRAAKETLRKNIAASRPKPPPHPPRPSSSSSSSSSSSPPRPSPSKVEDAQEDAKPKTAAASLPSVAATQVDEFGDRRIAKMTFKNVVRNIHTQDILGGEEDEDKQHSEAAAAAAEKPVARKAKKRITWRDQAVAGGSLMDVREIELVGKGRAVSASALNPRAFDAKQCLLQKRQTNPPPPPHHPPHPMQPPPPPRAQPAQLPAKPSATYYKILRQVTKKADNVIYYLVDFTFSALNPDPYLAPGMVGRAAEVREIRGEGKGATGATGIRAVGSPLSRPPCVQEL